MSGCRLVVFVLLKGLSEADTCNPLESKKIRRQLLAWLNLFVKKVFYYVTCMMFYLLNHKVFLLLQAHLQKSIAGLELSPFRQSIEDGHWKCRKLAADSCGCELVFVFITTSQTMNIHMTSMTSTMKMDGRRLLIASRVQPNSYFRAKKTQRTFPLPLLSAV